MLITVEALAAFPGPIGIRHAFFTRRGGVSGGAFASLNCGFGSRDAPADVAEQPRDRGVPARPRPDRLVSCHQVHGTTAITIEAAWRREQNPRADTMVTAMPGIALGVLAADCAPVLFADPEARIVGAADGGWRGALAGVMEATVAAMARLGARPERIRAGIGPCIAQPSYEVGAEFHEAFTAAERDNRRFFRPARFRPFSVRSALLYRRAAVAARSRRGRTHAA